MRIIDGTAPTATSNPKNGSSSNVHLRNLFWRNICQRSSIYTSCPGTVPCRSPSALRCHTTTQLVRSSTTGTDMLMKHSCCASGYYCGTASPNVIGCCANGQTCAGAIGGATTLYPVVVTVTSYYTGGGAVAPGGYYTITTTVYNTPATTPYVTATTTSINLIQGYCSTLTANGPGLPTVRQGSCGEILVVSKAASSTVLWSATALAVLLCILISM